MELKQKFPHSHIKVHDAAAIGRYLSSVAGKLEPVHAKRQAHDFDSTHFSCP
jgi:hypothetical protein